MKKISFYLAICMAVLCFASPAQAQFKWGIEGGVNMSKMSIDGDGGILDASNRTGWFIGPKAQFTVPVIGLGIDGAILYSQKYMKLELNDEGETDATPNKSMPYLEIPINVKYNIGLSSIFGVYIATGPQFGWYMGSRNISMGDISAGTLERSNFSWNVGLGVNALSHFQVGVTYNIPIGKTGEMKDAELVDVAKSIELKNNTWQVRLAYMF